MCDFICCGGGGVHAVGFPCRAKNLRNVYDLMSELVQW